MIRPIGFLKGLLALIVIAATVLFLCYQLISLEAKSRDLPAYTLTKWEPKGLPNASLTDPAIPDLITSSTMHYGINNNAQVMVAAAPEQKLDWVAETDFYVPEGPTLDRDSNVYFSPFRPTEDVSLVSLDGKTGERRWVIPAHGDLNGSGAILLLNSEDGSEQIIYHSTYSDAYAIKTSGEIIWHTKTGFKFAGKGLTPHTWGMNFLPGINAVSVVSEDGKLALFDRVTGKRLIADNIDLPGQPAGENYVDRPSDFISNIADDAGREVFGDSAVGDGLFTLINMIIFGGGKEVTNFYGSDPTSNRLYIAATSPDEVDGKKDGVSDTGAIYAIDFKKDDSGNVSSSFTARYDFDGGTGSTPTISNDGQYLFVSDENGNLITLNNELKELWRVNVGYQIAASISASADNNELYAVSAFHIIKVINHGDRGEIAWITDLDMYPGFNTVNALTAAITPNGIAVSLGASPKFAGEAPLMVTNGFGMLDKETGEVISFVDGYEESIAATMIAPDGGFVIGSSPVRRLASKGLFGDKVRDIRGGVARYKSTNNELLARDAICMAQRYQTRLNSYNNSEHPAATAWDNKQIAILTQQASQALSREVGELTEECQALNKQLVSKQ
jgi:hypothetical protein